MHLEWREVSSISWWMPLPIYITVQTVDQQKRCSSILHRQLGTGYVSKRSEYSAGQPPPKKKKKIVYTREWRGTWNHVEKKRDSYKWEWYPHRLFFWLFLFLFRGAQCHPSLKTTDWDRASRLEIAFCLAALCCCCLTHRRNAITTNILLLLLLLAYCRLENPTLLSPFLTSLLSSHRRWAESNYKSSFLIHFLVGFFFFSLFFTVEFVDVVVSTLLTCLLDMQHRNAYIAYGWCCSALCTSRRLIESS